MIEIITYITKRKSIKSKLKLTKKGKFKLILKDKIKTIGDESILISNIDSNSSKNFIECKCKKDKAFRMNDYNDSNKYYYCLYCGRLYKK